MSVAQRLGDARAVGGGRRYDRRSAGAIAEKPRSTSTWAPRGVRCAMFASASPVAAPKYEPGPCASQLHQVYPCINWRPLRSGRCASPSNLLLYGWLPNVAAHSHVVSPACGLTTAAAWRAPERSCTLGHPTDVGRSAVGRATVKSVRQQTVDQLSRERGRWRRSSPLHRSAPCRAGRRGILHVGIRWSPSTRLRPSLEGRPSART